MAAGTDVELALLREEKRPKLIERHSTPTRAAVVKLRVHTIKFTYEEPFAYEEPFDGRSGSVPTQKKTLPLLWSTVTAVRIVTIVLNSPVSAQKRKADPVLCR